MVRQSGIRQYRDKESDKDGWLRSFNRKKEPVGASLIRRPRIDNRGCMVTDQEMDVMVIVMAFVMELTAVI
ncbi:MAG: hypothetical protein WC291_07855 [Thermodesulfovibrionales bacterium]